MRTYLQSYGCTTGAGLGADAFFTALLTGKSAVSEGVCRISRPKGQPSEETAVQWLCDAWSQLPPLTGRSGVILCSAKGAIEDYLVQSPTSSWEFFSDSLTPVLTHFLNKTGLSPVRSLAVSNACASSHAAFFLAESWLDHDICDSVVVCAVEIVGEFIEKGFRSLRAVTASVPAPFSAGRDGLALGEGAAVLVLSRSPANLAIEGVTLVTEATSLTRPSDLAKGLEQACRDSAHEFKIDLIIAHGTGTKPNDAAEASVFRRLFPHAPVTGTKWCIGHSMGASGAMDVIAAAESLSRQIVFPIATTAQCDPLLGIATVTKATSLEMRQILVSSLGFGGMNAALRVRLVPT